MSQVCNLAAQPVKQLDGSPEAPGRAAAAGLRGLPGEPVDGSTWGPPCAGRGENGGGRGGDGAGVSPPRPYLGSYRINRASFPGPAPGIQPENHGNGANEHLASAWRYIWQTPDVRLTPDSDRPAGPDGWSFRLEPLPPGPSEFQPVAGWDLPDPAADDEPAAVPGEPDRAERPRYCGRYTVAGELRDPETGAPTGRLGVARIYCRQYGCKVCGPRKARAVRAAIQRECEARGFRRLATLTLDPAQVEASGLEPHAFLHRCFDRLRYRWQKAYSRGVEYIAVIEHHKSGLPHLHLALSRFIPQAVMFRWWAASGACVAGKPGAERSVWLTARDAGRVGQYVAKYIAKGFRAELRGVIEFPKRARRWTTSRGLRLFPRRPSQGWRFMRESIDRIAATGAMLREVLDTLTVSTDHRGALRFLVLAASSWWQIAFVLGLDPGPPAP